MQIILSFVYCLLDCFLAQIVIIITSMQSDSAAEKQMCSTNCKQRIFNVRKVAYKQYNPQRINHFKMSPAQQESIQPRTIQPKKKEIFVVNQVPNALKELRKKYQNLKEECNREKNVRLEKLKEREEQLTKFETESEKIRGQKERLQQKRDELKKKVAEIRERNQELRQYEFQRKQEIRLMNMEYLRNMIMAMRFQNGVDIDPDQMTYEELLELEEQMGSVSKGISNEQMEKLSKLIAKGGQEDCSICCSNITEGEELYLLSCKHYFHTQCLGSWLTKQKICPLCKQEVLGQKSQSLQSTQ